MEEYLALLDSSENDPINCHIDIVFCIDLTSGMQHAIDLVKSIAETFYEKVQEIGKYEYCSIEQLRVRVIGYRDVYCDGEKSFEVSDFFNLPDENEELISFLAGLKAEGGGESARNSLEALAMAMQSDWCQPIDPAIRKRHVIALFTDAPAHPLKKSKYGIDCNYPKDMPESYGELFDWWYGESAINKDINVKMDQIAKRLALFVPESSLSWIDYESFDSCLMCEVEEGNGCRDLSFHTFLLWLREAMFF